MSVFGLIGFLFKLLGNIIRTIYQYSVGQLPYRKGSESLRNALKMTLCKTGLQISVGEARNLTLFSNSTLVRHIMWFLHRSLVSSLPGYGEQHEEHSIWLVKHQDLSSDSPILIYFHGGGYYMQTIPEQLGVVLSIYKLTSAKVQAKLNILLLDYSLASDGYPVPTQLEQLFAAYLKLTTLGYTNIGFFGDSAGGHLSITFTQLLYHYYNSIPHPIVELLPPLQSTTPHIYPKTQILISPWVKMKPNPEDGATEGNSWHDNEPYDIIQFSNPFEYHHIVSSALSMSDIMVSPGNHGYTNTKEWLRVPSFQNGSSLLVIWGEDESFRDDIIEWCTHALEVPKGTIEPKKNYQYTLENNKQGPDIYLYMEPKGIHDSLFFLEDSVIGKVKGKKGKQLTYDNLDPSKYFAVVKVAMFLDTVFGEEGEVEV